MNAPKGFHVEMRREDLLDEVHQARRAMFDLCRLLFEAANGTNSPMSEFPYVMARGSEALECLELYLSAAPAEGEVAA